MPTRPGPRPSYPPAPAERPSEVAPGVFVGGLAVAPGFVGHRICVRDEGAEPGVPSEHVPVYDPEADRPIVANLDRVFESARAARARGEPVLFYCGHGVRRSPLAAAWYLHRSEGIPITEAYARIESVRPFVERAETWTGGAAALDPPTGALPRAAGRRRRAPLHLVPLADDPARAERLAVAAIEEAARRERPPQDPAPAVAWMRERLAAGTAEGRLLRAGGEPVGLLLWEGPAGLGRHLRAIVLAPGERGPAAYAAFFDLAEREHGPFQLVPSGWAGLAPEEESELLRRRGFAPFARSEMRRDLSLPLGDEPLPTGVRIRPVVPDDEAAIAAHHASAFHGHFDSFLFRQDADPVRDSAGAVREMLAGRWGPFLPWASTFAESEDGRSLGSCLFVRAPTGPLLISLQVDPRAQGRKIGRALTVASLRALAARGEPAALLNVTEGNERAVRLYESLGFVRSIGPGWAWFSERQVPVRPDGSLTRAPEGSSEAAGSRAGAAPRSRPA